MNEKEFQHKYDEFYRFCKEIFGVEVDTQEELAKLAEMKFAKKEVFERVQFD